MRPNKTLAKITLANSIDPSGNSITSNGFFPVLNFPSGLKKGYIVTCGDDVTMLRWTCWDWQFSSYPCKHFFTTFRELPAWQWEALSSQYFTETYSEPCQISTMECFEKIVKGFIFVKLTIVDICQSSEHHSVVNRLTYHLIKLLKTNLKNILLQILLGSFMNTLSHM